jgi:FSR family fosmidomycin resistance protein-like MFS transporter
MPAPAAQDWGQTLRRLLTLVMLAFIVLVAMRSSIQAVYQFLLPKLFEDRGWEPSLYGLLAGIYMGAAAVGNVLMGKLADRFGMRAVTVVSLLVSVPVGLLFLSTSSVLLIFAACALVGFLTGGQHSILVVHAQRLLPVRKGLAAGLILGFTFGSGTVGAWLCGFAADTYSLQNAMLVVVLLGIPTALLALLLPGRAGMGSSAQPVPARG